MLRSLRRPHHPSRRTATLGFLAAIALATTIPAGVAAPRPVPQATPTLTLGDSVGGLNEWFHRHGWQQTLADESIGRYRWNDPNGARLECWTDAEGALVAWSQMLPGEAEAFRSLTARAVSAWGEPSQRTSAPGIESWTWVDLAERSARVLCEREVAGGHLVIWQELDLVELPLAWSHTAEVSVTR